MMNLLIGLWVAVIIILYYRRTSLKIWTTTFEVLLLITTFVAISHVKLLISLWVIFLVGAALLNIKILRRNLFSRPFLVVFRKMLPKVSATERAALVAGTVSWEGELFKGQPNWFQLLKLSNKPLTEEEIAFIEGPVEQLCARINDWDITHHRHDLPPEIWQFMKTEGFFGLIIPKKYGGKEFSAAAHAAILVKLYSVSITAAITCGVPNSLGPAELLLHYGTEAQKDYYLPRLARGEEIPAFALTAPEAGSDASSIPDRGIACYEEFEGKQTL